MLPTMSQVYCLKCGTMNAGMTCSACGNMLITPESTSIELRKPQQYGVFTVLGGLVAAQLAVFLAAMVAIFSPSLKYRLKHRVEAVCNCKDELACVQR